MKYKILILFSIFCLVGCDAEYKVTIDESLSVKEEMSIVGDDRFQLGTNYTAESMFNILKDTYPYYDSDDYNEIIRSSKNGNIAVSLTKEYMNLEDFSNSYYLNLMYPEGLVITTEDNLVNLKGSGRSDYFWLFMPGSEDTALMETLKFSVKLPYLVKSSNADSVDEKTNTYTWEFTFKDDTKAINLTFDKSVKHDYNEQKKKLGMYFTIGIGVILLVVIGIIIYRIYSKNKENNKV